MSQCMRILYLLQRRSSKTQKSLGICPASSEHLICCCIQSIDEDVRSRGGSRISGKGGGGFICMQEWGVRFADFISFFLNIPWKWNNLVSLRPNNFIFIGYLKTGFVEGGSLVNPLWICHWDPTKPTAVALLDSFTWTIKEWLTYMWDVSKVFKAYLFIERKISKKAALSSDSNDRYPKLIWLNQMQ